MILFDSVAGEYRYDTSVTADVKHSIILLNFNPPIYIGKLLAPLRSAWTRSCRVTVGSAKLLGAAGRAGVAWGL
jgi:hypothetical protein